MKMVESRFQAAVLVAAAVSVLAFAATANAQNQNPNNQWSNGNSAPNQNPWPYANTNRTAPVLAVVGDVSCEPGEQQSGESAHETCGTPKAPYSTTSLWQSQEATANEIEALQPDLVAIAGDLQYQVGQFDDFENSYDLTYGAFKMITRPAPGNHEFYDEHGATGVAGYGYFSYFNGYQVDTTGQPITTTLADPCPSTMTGCGYPAATTPNPQPIPRSDGQAGHFEQTGGVGSTVPAGGTVGVGDGWYSYNLGSWHIISLNIECETQPGGCSTTGSWFASELEWLKKDLEANHSACTAAYWHQPTFSATNGITEEGITAQAFWQLLYQYNADLVLNGHDHLYARYQPVDPNGTPDRRRGIREFIVGTGGETLDPIVLTPVTSGAGETNQEDPTGNVNFNAQNLEAYSGYYWGVMGLTLSQNGYSWDFESALAGPPALSNGPTLPAPNANGTYSDKGFGTCHGSPTGW
jgi:hypothetical protein